MKTMRAKVVLVGSIIQKFRITEHVQLSMFRLYYPVAINAIRKVLISICPFPRKFPVTKKELGLKTSGLTVV